MGNCENFLKLLQVYEYISYKIILNLPLQTGQHFPGTFIGFGQSLIHSGVVSDTTPSLKRKEKK